MKKTALFVIFAILFFQYCDTLDELSTIDLETDLNKEIPVNIAEEDPATVNETFSVSALDDSEIEKYKEQIKEFKVNKVSYQILQYSGASGITLSGTFDLGPVDVQVEDLDLESLSNSGEIQELDLLDSELQQLANELDQSDEITGTISGTVSGKPVSFILKIIFDVSFRAEVL